MAKRTKAPKKQKKRTRRSAKKKVGRAGISKRQKKHTRNTAEKKVEQPAFSPVMNDVYVRITPPDRGSEGNEQLQFAIAGAVFQTVSHLDKDAERLILEIEAYYEEPFDGYVVKTEDLVNELIYRGLIGMAIHKQTLSRGVKLFGLPRSMCEEVKKDKLN